MILVFLFLAFGFAVVLLQVKRRRVDFLSIFSITYVVFYSIVPVHVLLGGRLFVHGTFQRFYMNYGVGSIKGLVAIIATYFTIYILYNRFEFRSVEHGRKAVSYNIVYGAIWVSLFITSISILIYTKQYGGFIEAVQKAALIRSGEVESESFAFFKRFFSFAHMALLLSFSLLLRDWERGLVRTKILSLMTISAVFVLVVTLLLAGRIRILITVGACYLTFSTYRGGFHLKLLAPLGILSILFVLFGTEIFIAIQDRNLDLLQQVVDEGVMNSYQTIIRTLSSPYLSLEVAIRHSDAYDPRMIVDYLLAPLYLIPQQIFEIELPGTVSFINTDLAIGEYRSVVIPGLVASLWYSGSWIAIVIGSAGYGLIGKHINSSLRSLEEPTGIIVYYLAALMWGFSYVRSGDPRILLLGNIPWILAIVSLYVLASHRPELNDE